MVSGEICTMNYNKIFHRHKMLNFGSSFPLTGYLLLVTGDW